MPQDMDLPEIRKRLQAACRDAGSARTWAKQNDLSESYVSDVLSGRRDVSDRILAALSIIKVITYREVRQ